MEEEQGLGRRPERGPESKLLESVLGWLGEVPDFTPRTEEELKAALSRALETLKPRQAGVLRLRFGIEDGQAKTLKEVGEHYNITAEGARQIEAKALRKLRHPSRRQELGGFLLLPEDSDERRIFGPILRRDLAVLKEGLGSLYPLYWETLGSILEAEPGLATSQVVWPQLRESLFGVFLEEKERLFPPPPPEPTPLPFENHLLPEVELSWEQRTILARSNLRVLGLSARPFNQLRRSLGREVTLAQIVGRSPKDLLAISQFGQKCLEELQEKLKNYLRQQISPT